VDGLKAKALGRAAACAGAAAALVPAWLILRYGVDVPYSDQWNIAHFFEKAARGTLTFADLYAQQNEYRQLFPHLLFVGLGRLTSWNVKYEMCLSLLLACFVAGGVWRLGARTFADPLLRGMLFLPACLLNFSAMQYDNWLFGVQVVYFVPAACVVAGLLFAYSERVGTAAAVFACACVSAVSSFSSANGLVAWLVLPPALLAARRLARAKAWRWLVPWCAALLLCALAYVSDYRRPESLPETSEALRRPLEAAAYFVAYLGGPLAAGPRPLTVALSVGACALLLYAFACSYVLRHGSDETLVRRSAAWASLGAYSLVTGALVTAGRVGFGVQHATTTRYVGFSLYLLLGLVYLLPLIAEDAARRGYLTTGHLALSKRLGTAAAALLVLAHVVIFGLVVRHGASDWRRKLLREKACLLFIDVAPDEQCLTGGRFYHDARLLRERAESLDEMHYLRPPLVKSGRMRELVADGSCAEGSFKIALTADGTHVAEGEARLPRRGGEPADAVILSSGTTDEDQTVFALTELGGARGDASWSKTFSSNAPPPKLAAWAFDAEEGKAYRLCGANAVSLPH
jgi:hypothetical protein